MPDAAWAISSCLKLPSSPLTSLMPRSSTEPFRLIFGLAPLPYAETEIPFVEVPVPERLICSFQVAPFARRILSPGPNAPCELMGPKVHQGCASDAGPASLQLEPT